MNSLNLLYLEGNTLRDCKELETRYTTKLTTEHRFKFKDKMYEISIVGDSVGDCKDDTFSRRSSCGQWCIMSGNLKITGINETIAKLQKYQ